MCENVLYHFFILLCISFKGKQKRYTRKQKSKLFFIKQPEQEAPHDAKNKYMRK